MKAYNANRKSIISKQRISIFKSQINFDNDNFNNDNFDKDNFDKDNFEKDKV